jgi:hypothetical protein
MVTKLPMVEVLFKNMQPISKAMCSDCNLMMNEELTF